MINYSLEYKKVGTGSSYGAIAEDEHASRAVRAAIDKIAPESTIGSVLLFLSSAYAHAPQDAIKLAAKVAGTPQIFGCCALNLLCDEEWLMDVEGAVAMVFTSEMALQPLRVMEQLKVQPQAVLTLASPNASSIATNTTELSQFGSLCSDEFGHGPYSIWQSGRIQEHEFSLSAFPPQLKPHTIVTAGEKALSKSMQINLSKDHDLQQVDQRRAFDTLPENLKTIAETQPYQLLCCTSETNNPNELEQGLYSVNHVIAADRESGVVQISGRPKAGRYMFWAIRDAESAEKSIQEALLKLKISLERDSDKTPLFALMFPNISRGPEFYNGLDRDFECFKGTFPDVPMIGFYGNGEIAESPITNKNMIRQYATVITVFTEQ